MRKRYREERRNGELQISRQSDIPNIENFRKPEQSSDENPSSLLYYCDNKIICSLFVLKAINYFMRGNKKEGK